MVGKLILFRQVVILVCGRHVRFAWISDRIPCMYSMQMNMYIVLDDCSTPRTKAVVRCSCLFAETPLPFSPLSSADSRAKLVTVSAHVLELQR